MYVRPDLSEGTAHGAGPRWCTTPAKGGPPGGRSNNCAPHRALRTQHEAPREHITVRVLHVTRHGVTIMSGAVKRSCKRSNFDFLVVKSRENDVSCGPSLTLVGGCHQACAASRCWDMMDKEAFAEGTRNQSLLRADKHAVRIFSNIG